MKGARSSMPDNPQAANFARQYVNTRLVSEIAELAAREKRMKHKHVEACAMVMTASELVDAQRARIQDLEDWMRDICQVRTLAEAKRFAHEALW